MRNGNGFKLKEGGFRLALRKMFYTMRVLKNWNRLARGWDAPSMEIFIGHGSKQPDIIEDVPAPYRGVGLDDL